MKQHEIVLEGVEIEKFFMHNEVSLLSLIELN